MRKILVSACLYGDIVRYDGKDAAEQDSRFLKWKEEGRLVKICPEVFGGLSTPRSDSQRAGDRIMTRAGEDVTEAYEIGAVETVRLARDHDVAFAIMKQRSPSCGSRIIYDGTFSGARIPGEGRATQLLREAGFTVFGEEEMEEAAAMLREIGE